MLTSLLSLFFFFNDTATTEIYTLSLHDALPICVLEHGGVAACTHVGQNLVHDALDRGIEGGRRPGQSPDRKSTRLNSSHLVISYAVFCLKKKKAQRPRLHY